MDNCDVNTYLKSLLLPKTGPATLPDDRVMRHTLRQETITYNLKAPQSGCGLIVLYPNSPTALLGAHYIKEGDSFKFDKKITTAQDLSDNYNYGRKVSGVIEVKSSTLPSGVYSLNGTFNAVTYEGSLSEIGLQEYNNLLQVTSNPLDKIGNVLVGDGITVLTLPTGYEHPYFRLDDKSPSERTETRIRDSSDSLTYTGSTIQPSIDFVNRKALLFSANVDSNVGVTFTGNFILSCTSETPPATSVEICYLGLTGEEFITKTYPVGPWNNKRITVSINDVYPTTDFIDQPICSVAVRLYIDKALSMSTFGAECIYAITSYAGNAIGVDRVVTLIAYEQVAPETAITIAGVANYELIPNPLLARNVPTSYGHYDPTTMEYVKKLMSKRDCIGLRTLWKSSDYNAREPLLLEMATHKYTDHNSVAASFGFSDVLNFFKKASRFVTPALAEVGDTFLPGSGQHIRALGDLFANSASGGVVVPIDYKISSQPTFSTTGGMFANLNRNFRYSMDSATASTIFHDEKRPGCSNVSEPLTSAVDIGLEDESRWIEIGSQRYPKATLFPTVDIDEDTGAITGTQLYICLPGNRTSLLPKEARRYQTQSANKKKIFGLSSLKKEFAMKGDVTVVAVDAIKGSKVLLSSESLPVVGRSSELAIHLLDKVKSGLPPFVFTGEVSMARGGLIQPVVFVKLKKQEANKNGFKIVANSVDADLPAVLVEDVVRMLETTTEALSEHLFRRTPGAHRKPLRHTWSADSTLQTAVEMDLQGMSLEQLQDIWFRVSHEIARRDPEFDSSVKNLGYIEEKGLSPYVSRFRVLDPEARRLTTILINSTPTAPLDRGKSDFSYVPLPRQSDQTTAAQAAKAQRISDGAMSTGNMFATVEWVIRNGYTGPSQAQISYYRNTGMAPEPGNQYLEYMTRPIPKLGKAVTPQKIVDVLRSRFGREPNEDEISILTEYVQTHGNKFPDAVTYNQILPVQRKGLSGGERRQQLRVMPNLPATRNRFSTLYGASELN